MLKENWERTSTVVGQVLVLAGIQVARDFRFLSKSGGNSSSFALAPSFPIRPRSWPVYKTFMAENNVTSKKETATIALRNSNVRHYLARFKRTVKCYSKKEAMV